MLAYQLIATAGSNRGTCWPAGEKPLVFGRAADCDVVLKDPLVSRCHCRVFVSGGALRYEDLGSRNPALINGVPCKKNVLEPGDELALGKDIFFVGVATLDGRAGAPVFLTTEDTLSIDAAQRGLVEQGLSGPALSKAPRTVYDLAELRNTFRSFCMCQDLPELFVAATQRLRERFEPAALWLARVYRVDDLTFFDVDEGAKRQDAPMEAISAALRKCEALLVPADHAIEGPEQRTLTIAVPAMHAETPVAVIAMRSKASRETYHQWDLDYALFLAQTLAPFVPALETASQLRRENERLRSKIGASCELVGQSEAMLHVKEEIARAAQTRLNVLLAGETGTGKELAARSLHAQSPRAAGPFVAVNCAAIPRELFEAHIFGHEKGAFTGANQASDGLAAQAHGGTLFLDEIGDLSPDNQARILRVIENGTFHRVGGATEIQVDLRIVAASNKDLDAAMEEGKFRQDLYHRLRGFVIQLPPLRDRVEDIPLLAQHFFEMAKDQARHPLEGISSEVIRLLKRRRWPGNVRELRNCIQRATAVAREDLIQPEDVRETGALPVRKERVHAEATSLADAEKQHIQSVLNQCGGDVREAASRLKVGRSTLYRKIADYGIEL